MDLLKRELAPILPGAWEVIDAEAARVLKLNLAGRKLVDVSDPQGWSFAAVNTGRLEPLGEPGPAVEATLRRVQPLVELRAPIRLSLSELDIVARGGIDPDLANVVTAAERVSEAEDAAIFNGSEAAGIRGIFPSSPHDPIEVRDADDYARAVLDGIEVVRKAGVNGPYALALGPGAFDELFAAREDGYPLANQIRELIEGPLVLAPAISGGVLISTRGGDYELTLGQDLSIGYAYHERKEVELYLTESFTFRVLEPAAAVCLRRPS